MAGNDTLSAVGTPFTGFTSAVSFSFFSLFKFILRRSVVLKLVHVKDPQIDMYFGFGSPFKSVAP